MIPPTWFCTRVNIAWFFFLFSFNLHRDKRCILQVFQLLISQAVFCYFTLLLCTAILFLQVYCYCHCYCYSLLSTSLLLFCNSISTTILLYLHHQDYWEGELTLFFSFFPSFFLVRSSIVNIIRYPKLWVVWYDTPKKQFVIIFKSSSISTTNQKTLPCSTTKVLTEHDSVHRIASFIEYWLQFFEGWILDLYCKQCVVDGIQLLNWIHHVWGWGGDGHPCGRPAYSSSSSTQD